MGNVCGSGDFPAGAKWAGFYRGGLAVSFQETFHLSQGLERGEHAVCPCWSSNDQGSGGEKQQQQNTVNGNTPVGNTTEGALEKTMTNEVGSLNTPKGADPGVLVDAKTALANALINNAHWIIPQK